MKVVLRYVLFYAAMFISVEAYKVLVVNPFPVRSLSLLGEGFVRHLLNAGHEVTFVTSYPKKHTNNERYHEVDVSSNILNISGDGFSLKSIMDNEMPINDIKMLQDYALFNALNTFEDKNFQKLLGDTNESFDAVLVDYYETEIYAGLSALYDCPMIWATSMGPHWQALRLVDESSNPSYTADYLSSNTVPFTFKERLEELWAQIKWTWIKWTSTLPQERDAYEKIFKPLLKKRGKNLPDYYKLMYNASFMFSNDHYAFGGIPKVPQNVKLIGGYHIEHPPKPLPQDLQYLMDNAKHGVIYFSMGSTWNSKDLPKSVIEGLLKMFGELEQTVIWKFEENLPNKPDNLKILQWAPQSSILAHPNCLFFITHGGLLSSTEAIHFGVPIIGIPIFFDQFVNINKATAKGYAIRVPLNYELPKHLRHGIRTMLADPKYRQLAKELSSIYHHRPLPPGKEVVHWVEHVIKTKGAKHLRSPALDVPFYRKLYLDLAAILITAAILLWIAVKRLTSKRLCSTKQNKQKTN